MPWDHYNLPKALYLQLVYQFSNFSPSFWMCISPHRKQAKGGVFLCLPLDPLPCLLGFDDFVPLALAPPVTTITIPAVTSWGGSPETTWTFPFCPPLEPQLPLFPLPPFPLFCQFCLFSFFSLKRATLVLAIDNHSLHNLNHFFQVS